MIPVFLVAAGALALLAVGGGKKGDGKQSVEGLAADAALDEILDEDFTIPEGLIVHAKVIEGARPQPRSSAPKTRAGAKRTKAKRMQIKLPKIKKVNWSAQLRGGKSGNSSKTPRLDSPKCEMALEPSKLVIKQAKFIAQVKGEKALSALPAPRKTIRHKKI